MKPYKVTWEIDVEAEDAVDAARRARKAQAPETEALVFACKERGKRPVYIDLMEVAENLNEYDGAEMRYCVELIDAGENPYVESFRDEAEAGCDEQFTDRVCNRFWSVYLHYDPAGSKTGVECIADCPLKEYAELIAESVDMRVRGKEVLDERRKTETTCW